MGSNRSKFRFGGRKSQMMMRMMIIMTMVGLIITMVVAMKISHVFNILIHPALIFTNLAIVVLVTWRMWQSSNCSPVFSLCRCVAVHCGLPAPPPLAALPCSASPPTIHPGPREKATSTFSLCHPGDGGGWGTVLFTFVYITVSNSVM